jgi:hypothetical protein
MTFSDILIAGVILVFFSGLTIWGVIEIFRLDPIRFTLRRLLVIMTAVAVILGIVAAAARWD